MSEKYYVTTAIDYPNGKPHLGHAYEKFIADTLARFNRLVGKEVFFLTGTDEHGFKLEQVAEKNGLTPKQFVDNQSKLFKQFATDLNISNDDFIRTTDEKHIKLAKEIFLKVYNKGDIYLGKYEGNYCVHCESYFTELQLIDGNCPQCNRPVKWIEEDAYFFKLGKYKSQIVKNIKNTDFIQPLFRKNEILSRLDNELKDLCVSRSSFSWGIPLPINAHHVIYVWFDALINYISGGKWWPADCHVIGKDITWFHSVIWPAILLAADYPLPKQIYVHGFINDGSGEKMSKSKGNIIDPYDLLTKYHPDIIRYYLLRTIPSGSDGNFSECALVERYNSELGNELGNLLQRGLSLYSKYFDGEVKSEIPDELFEADISILSNEIKKYNFKGTLDLIWKNIKSVNQYINKTEPWKIIDNKKLSKVLYTVIDSLRLIAITLKPFLPYYSLEIFNQLAIPEEDLSKYKWGLTKDHKLGDAKILFEKKVFLEKPTFPLFLRVGKVIEINDHPHADKLYVILVDLGDEKRTVVAGLKPFIPKDELINKNIVLVTNLKKTKLRGIESQGMILAAELDGVVEIITSNEDPGFNVYVDAYKISNKEISFEEFMKIKLVHKNFHIYYNNERLKGIFTKTLINNAEIR